MRGVTRDAQERTETVRLRSELDDAHQAFKESQNEVALVQGKLDAVDEVHADALRIVENEARAYKGMLDDAKRRLKAAQDDLGDQTRLKAELKAARDEIAGADDRAREKVQDEIRVARRKVAGMWRSLKTAEAEREHAMVLKQEAEEWVDIFKSSVGSDTPMGKLVAEMEKMKADVKSRDSDIAALREQLTEMEELRKKEATLGVRSHRMMV